MTPKAETVVLFDSPEAARMELRNVWISRTGRTFLDEQGARYDGCTHRRCAVDGCAEIVPRDHWMKCREHLAEQTAARYAALPLEDAHPAPDSFIFSDAADRYFHGWDEVIDYAHEHEITDLAGLHLRPTEPVFLRQLDEDVFQEELGEDCDLADACGPVAEAFEALNAAIREHRKSGRPSCWRPVEARILIPEAALQALAEKPE